MNIEAIELFHLLFLDQLGRKIDKKLYALKGGCNLRFFLKSVRYSQDIDFDIHIIRKDTLSKTVNHILHSTPFQLILQSNQIELLSFSEPKQTETTQRWKLSLKSGQSDLPLNSKIEFSRRGLEKGICLDTIDPLLAKAYQLRPFFVPHYSAENAYLQKVKALIYRTETQARDVFDLFHLISMGIQVSIPEELKKHLPHAVSNALNISYDVFSSQVLSFLSLEDQESFNDVAIWEKIVLCVVEELNHAVN